MCREDGSRRWRSRIYRIDHMGRCPMLIWDGPLTLAFMGNTSLKSGLMTDLLTGRVRVPETVTLASVSANGAASNQPGATPQVKDRKQNEG